MNVNRSKRPFYLGLIWTITPLRHLDNEGALDSVMHIASKVIQPAAVPITPITPPLVQQSSVEQDTQPEQTAWWGEEPQQ